MNPYEVLGVARDADAKAVKSAFLKRAKTAHPDAGGDAESFDRLTRAKNVLVDPVRREKFDRTGTMEDTVDNSAGQSFQILMQTLYAVLDLVEKQQMTLEHVDVLGMVRNDLQANIEQTTRNEHELRKKAGEVRKVAERFKSKKGSENRIAAAFEAKAQEYERSADGLVQSRGLLEEALKTANAHDFDFTPAPPRDPYAQMRAMPMGGMNQFWRT